VKGVEVPPSLFVALDGFGQSRLVAKRQRERTLLLAMACEWLAEANAWPGNLSKKNRVIAL
jgi:hypothetical protein